ncbi:X-linked retinitis pigmentosa GTPase regulator-like isoform X2 [Ornithodoros turicata]|uniref:X-linked retinitis pigmentosa GTPase regulator-like isoform X2 n=1 Tax=Ornithodoros turicata TaxID=34597 RepID=UPI00313A3EE6
MTIDEEEDMPGTGAVCTFGKTRFAGNAPGLFWVKNDPVIQIACGDEHSVFFTASGQVFSFGSNEYGQLGQGHTKTVSRPRCIKALRNKRAVFAACGRAHTLIATDDSKVYGFGMNTEHQLGLNSKEDQHVDPVVIEQLNNLQIKQLTAGAEHSVALTDKGTAYVWGGGKEGQLGLGSKNNAPVPLELKVDIRIMCVSAGYYHTAIVSVDGILYTFGERDGGKLGLPKSLCCKRYNKPTEVSTIPGKVVSVSCGGMHSLALTAEGKVYAFGDGKNGQLGLGNKTLQTTKPQQVTFSDDARVAKVVCGESHSAFFTEKRQLFICGDARHGKLALQSDDSSANQFTPALVDQLLAYQVQQVSCGGCHTLILVVPSSEQVDVANNAGGAGDVSLARLKRRHRKATLIEHDDDSDGCEEDAKVTARVLSDTAASRPHATPLLQEAETDTSIRHVDSDVSDEDESEMSVLNKDGFSKTSEALFRNGDKAKMKLNGPKDDAKEKVTTVVKKTTTHVTKVVETPNKKVTEISTTVVETPKKKLAEKPVDTSDVEDKSEEASKLISSEADTPRKKGASGGKRAKKKKKGADSDKEGEGDNQDAKGESKSSACSVM